MTHTFDSGGFFIFLVALAHGTVRREDHKTTNMAHSGPGLLSSHNLYQNVQLRQTPVAFSENLNFINI